MTYNVTVTVGENSYPVKVYSGIAAPANRNLVIPYSASLTINWDIADSVEILLTGNLNLTMENGFHTQKCLLILKQDNIGSRQVTFPNSINLGGATIVLSTGANKKDILGFIRDSNSSKYDFLAIRTNM